MARINVFGKPIEYDVGVSYDSSGKGTPKILEPGKDDLSKETKAAVVENASNETRGSNDPEKRNRYPVGAGFNEISLHDVDGNPVPLDSTSNTSARTNGTGKQFVESREDLDNLNNYSNSTVSSARTLKTPGKIEPTLKKGKKTIGPDEHDGNTLLKDGVQKIQDSYVSPILSNNRFTAAGARGVNSPVKVNPHHPVDTLGSYRNFRESNDGKDINDGHMANIGALLTIRSTLEVGSLSAYGQDGPDGALASVATLLPGGAQIGALKVPVDDLRPIDVLKSIIEDGTDPVNLDPEGLNDHYINDTGSSSFGQMNNVLEPFTGLLPLGMIAASTALVIAMRLALSGLTALLAKITTAGKSNNVKKDSQGRYILGSYIHSAASQDKFPPLPIPAKFLGLTTTVHDYEKCVSKGMEQVFGESLVSTSGASFKRVLETPGYYAVLCRTIVRSAAGIVIAIQNAVKGNPIQVAQNIIEMVNIIRSSKVIATMNVMATIGDQVLTLEDRPRIVETILGTKKISSVDALPDEFRVGKGRRQGTTHDALATNTSPSAFLFPKEFLDGAATFTQLSGRPVNLRAVTSMMQANATISDDSRRIPSEIVKKMEADLEGEYVPFYFHDLRTNEIVSFHAFLTAMGDSFVVESETSKPVGRVDPVKIYKSTERKISVEFWAVATSPEDFDYMWWKINKLSTLVYPQWTKGQSIQTDDYKFTQPFSQVPGNSPLFRLRLGDVFKSNYSRFALARLFGLGQKDSTFSAGVHDIAWDKLKQNKSSLKFEDFLNLPDGVDVIPGVYAIQQAASSGFGIDMGPDLPPDIDVPFKTAGTLVGFEDDEEICLVELKNTTFKVRVPLNNLIGNETGGRALADRMYDKAELSQEQVRKTVDFFNPEKNSIIKSFEASGGKGLACMIDNMEFQWLQGIPWETETYGSRAPMMAQIKLSLTPIHDIAPGIDHNGFNRAPIYNVGSMVNAIGHDVNDNEDAGRQKFEALREKARKVFQR